MGSGLALQTLRARAATARAEGRRHLLESEALDVVAALGIATPRRVVIAPEEEGHPGFARLAGRGPVVVKALAPGLIHKSEAGAVVVAADREAAAAAMRTMAASVPGIVAVLVEEFVAHDPGPAGSLLVGVRWTDEFGPVAVAGAGGIYTEYLAMAAGGGTLAVLPAEEGDERDRAALAAATGLGPALAGYRGLPPAVTAADLAGVLRALLDLGPALPADLAELEINPLVATGGGLVALDVVAALGPAGTGRGPPEPRPGVVGRMLAPETVAVVGVSANGGPGRIVLDNLLRAGRAPETITVVKPGVAAVAGCRAVPSVADLDPPADLLVVALPAARVPATVAEVVDRKAAAGMVLVAGGLGEVVGSGGTAEALAAALRRGRTQPGGGPRVVGPNSLGIRSVPGRVDTFFIPADRMPGRPGPPHPLAVVTQSGAFALSRVDALPWLRPAYQVSLGNQADLTVGDFAAHFAADPAVTTVACYVEGFRPGDGRRLLEAAITLGGRGGATVLYRAGRSRQGAAAAASHTASLAGDYAVTIGAARWAGVLIAESLDEWEDLVTLAVLGPPLPPEARIAVVTNAGFEAVAAADHLGSLRLAPLAGATRDALAAVIAEAGLAALVTPANPLDLTPAAGDDTYEAVLGVVLADPGVDAVVAGCVPFTPALGTAGPEPGLAARVAALAAGATVPLVAVVDAGTGYEAFAASLAAAGIPVLRRMDRAIRALATRAAAGKFR